MMITALPLETETAITQILSKHYPSSHYCFKIMSIVEDSIADIIFEGYYTKTFTPTSRPSPDCFTKNNRNTNLDFSLYYDHCDRHLKLSSRWKGELLSLSYKPPSSIWTGESANVIYRPYPDGDKFEAIATSLYEIMLKHFL
ncbi:hypothetical protein Cri9333_0351 [Crinalium epipsammum PCC 9333]|uniref:Uncharacterized protein n=1 Tax=Crinalium epipsammum PCC 9333 TaxID=1173022 RepID=K9VV19_9CYAN|nr:hypothetical protein [Crinalium epipsammum]AFZ11332.1 hypothetical protein Cri9333_0351 [Crinalium epipsammum PCC 9333]